jgi:F-type H+-transporting ATPase subunit b
VLVDWFTVGAQVFNFLILVWLLKRFLYKPILDAVDARETRIKTERADADAIKQAAEAERDAFEKKSAAFDQDRAALIEKATAEAATERQRLLTEARTAADALTAKRAKALLTEARALDTALANRARDEVFAIARKTLKDLADVDLEDRVCDVFLRRITDLGDEPAAAVSEAIKATPDPILVRSAFALSEARRVAIASALRARFATEARPRFETAPDLVSGIELTVGGQKLSWSIADYLTSLKAGVGEVLSADASPPPDPKAALAPEGVSA